VTGGAYELTNLVVFWGMPAVVSPSSRLRPRQVFVETTVAPLTAVTFGVVAGRDSSCATKVCNKSLV